MALSLESKPLDDITVSDLQELIDDAIPEGRTIDYKSTLPSTSERDKFYFAADITALANSAGGYIIYGMEENNGVASNVVGQEDVVPDKLELGLQGVLRARVVPRLVLRKPRFVALQSGGYALVIYVQRSWTGPHAVVVQSDDRNRFAFYARHTNGNYEMDIEQVRAAFVGSEMAATRVRNFRAERIAHIAAGETPVPLPEGPLVTLHLVPLNAFDLETRYDLTNLWEDDTRDFAWPLGYVQSGLHHRLNLDGFLVSYMPERKRPSAAESYLQVYRTGVLETAWRLPLKRDEGREIESLSFENLIVEALGRYLHLLRLLEVQIPVVLLVTIINVRGYSLSVHSWSGLEPESFDRDILFLPETIITDYDVEAGDLLRDTLTTLWNAVNIKTPPYYKDGKWMGAQA